MTIEQVVLTKVFVSDKSKEGKEFIARNGRKYWKVAIQIDLRSYEGKWLSCLAFDGSDEILGWRAGDVQNIIIEEENGYLNFRVPEERDMFEIRLSNLENDFRQLKDKLDRLGGYEGTMPVVAENNPPF